MILPMRRPRQRAFVSLALLLFLLFVFFTRLERGLRRLDQILSLPRAEAVNGTDQSGNFTETAVSNSTRPGLDTNYDHTSKSVTVTSVYTSTTTLALRTSTPSALPRVELVKGGVPPSEAALDFWEDLLAAMVDARPDTEDKVVIQDPVNDYDMNANALIDLTRELIDKTHLSQELQEALETAHRRFRRTAERLSRRLPFTGKSKTRHGNEEGTPTSTEPASTFTSTSTSTPTPTPTAPTASVPTRGIVMTAGGNYIGVAVTSLLMLRRNGSKLPVQLFLDEVSGYAETLCEQVLPGLGAECHSMKHYWNATPDMPELSKFQYKVFAILFSSYREVLFLDADVWPVKSVDHLFEAEPYKSRGLVTWPDFWLPTAAPTVYAIMGIPTPAVTDRRSSEAGLMLYDKARHSLSLLLAAYYNFYGPDYYYPLLSQGAHGEGDKETFLHAALVAGEPFYAVHTRTGTIGRWLNGEFHSVGMKQADPEEDFELFEAMQAKKSAGEALQVGLPTTTKMAYDGGDEPEDEFEEEKDNSAFFLDEGDPDFDDDPDNYEPMTEEEAAKKQDEEETIRAQTLFVHHNLYKMDVRQLGSSMGNVYNTEDGHMRRLWGDESELDASAGYDVEKAMWTEIGRAVCEPTRPGTGRACSGGGGRGSGPLVTSKECDDFARYYEEVFGGSWAEAEEKDESM